MKVLIYTSIFPYPLNEGGKAAQYSFIESLVKEDDVLLVCEKYNECEKDVSVLEKTLPSLKIKLLEVTQHKKEKTFINLLLSFTEKVQWRLKKKLPIIDNKENQLLSNPFFINPVRPKKPEIIEQLLKTISEEQPDIIQVDFIDNADIGIALPKNIPSVLVLHDLRFSSIEQSAMLAGLNNEYAIYLKDYVRALELGFIKNFSAVITFSIEDKNLLKTVDAEINVVTIPFAVLDKNMANPENENTIEKIVFIGPEHHVANYDAIKWYANEIESEVWGKNKIKLSVIGKWSEKTIKEFSRNSGIEFLGFVDDLKEVFKSSAMIVPLRIGSGIRSKILDAFAFGIRVISSTLGCEGLGVEDGKEILIADSAQEFARSIIRLSKDKVLAKKISTNANQLVTTKFSQTKIYLQRMDLYNRLLTQHLNISISALNDN